MRALLLVVVLLGIPAICFAQSQSFTIRAGFANTDPVGFGDFHVFADDRRVFESSVGYSHLLADWTHITVAYHADIVPVTLISDPAVKLVNSTTNQQFAYRIDLLSKWQTLLRTSGTRITTYGAGADPLGFEAHLRPSQKWRPFANCGTGFRIFTHEEPINRTSAFNFAFSFGGGIEMRTHEGRVLTLGYKMLHFSNANLGRDNPGVNTNFIYTGVRFGR